MTGAGEPVVPTPLATEALPLAPRRLYPADGSPASIVEALPLRWLAGQPGLCDQAVRAAAVTATGAEHRDTPLAELYPGIAARPETPVAPAALTQDGALHRLRSHGVRAWGELATVTAAQLADWPHMTTIGTELILRACGRASIDAVLGRSAADRTIALGDIDPTEDPTAELARTLRDIREQVGTAAPLASAGRQVLALLDIDDGDEPLAWLLLHHAGYEQDEQAEWAYHGDYDAEAAEQALARVLGDPPAATALEEVAAALAEDAGIAAVHAEDWIRAHHPTAARQLIVEEDLEAAREQVGERSFIELMVEHLVAEPFERASADALVAAMVRDYEIPAAAVRAALRGDERFVVAGDMVRLRRQAAPAEETPAEPPGAVRGLLRAPGGRPRLRWIVDEDLAAGAAQALDPSAGPVLGLRQGQRCSLETGHGAAELSWRGRRLSVERLDHLAAALGAAPGDVVLLDIDPEAPQATVHRVAAEELTRLAGPARLAAALGLPADAGHRSIARTLWFKGPASFEEITARLRERGETELAALLQRPVAVE